MTFDPNSNDAMFAQILAKLDEQKSLLDDIKESLEKAEHRITLLEHWREELKGKVAIVAAATSLLMGTLVSILLHFLLK